MSKFTALLGCAIALIAGGVIGRQLTLHQSIHAVSGVAPPAIDVERYRIPINGSPIRGNERAKVTIVEFSDFECPFCSRLEPTLTELQAKYGRDLRLVWKDFPLPQHRDALGAALAGRAAAAQGKFWPMHDRMFADARGLNRDGLQKTATALAIDVSKAFDDPTLQALVRRDQADARTFGVNGTPKLFINGRPFRGQITVAALSAIVDEELANAERALAAGADARDLYAALTKDARPSAQPPAPAQQPHVEIAVGDSPVRGKRDAKVTVVEFSDFQCPACGRAEPTVQALQKQLGDNVQLVWKHMPLDMHPFARQAAEAALAAGAQGHFWEMHDKLFANQTALDRASLERYATELHLNLTQFKQALDKQTYRARVDADIALAKQLGVAGTPTFFVDGQRVANWPADLTATAQRDLARPQTAARTQTGRPDPTAIYRATVGDAPVRGATNPKVTLVEWADFECPYCARLNDAIDTVLQRHPDDLRVVYKQFPLANHPHGPIAAEASLAAKAQGRFWPMQKALFAHQAQLDRAGLSTLAQSVGLDVGKLTAALDSGTYKQAANAEAAQGAKIGVSGTPAFFIDGKFYSGALPVEQLDAAVTQAIAAADARIAKGTPRAQLYDALMRTALTEVKQPPAVEAQKQDVDPGASAPSRGRREAPVTIVEFSDFQCPYCKRAASLVEEVQKQHGDDVRVVFRNFPLPYHKNAQLAASAALAAKEQGRFWQMHDQLFAHQDSLDRAAIDGFALALGLDVAKFDAALDGGKLSDAINRDVAAGLPLVDGTPTLFVNGHKLSNPALLAQVVDDELHHKH